MDKHKSNEWYINGIQQKSPAVLKALSAHFFPMVQDYVTKNSGTKEDAKDLFNDAIITIYRKVQDGDLELTSKFSTYLFSICKNQWLNKLRRKKKISQVTIDDSTVYTDVRQFDMHFETTERYKLMREKFKVLSKDCQQVLELSWNNDLSGQEIATKMGWSHGYLRKRKHKCKEKLVQLVRRDRRFVELKN